MKRHVTVLAAAVLACAWGAVPARGATLLAASWVVTYSLDPLGTQGATACVNFAKKSESNGVIIGTWKSATYSGWSGEWVQRGQHFQWHGSYAGSGGITVATYDVGDFINPNTAAETSAASFSIANGTTSLLSSGTATLVQVQSCKGHASLRPPSDPLRGF